MMKQKFMYLLCLLMFAVGINAQHINGTFDQGTNPSYKNARSTTVTSQTSSYDAATGEVTFTFVIGQKNTTQQDGQVVTISGSNLNITSVTINGINATKSNNSAQPDANGERTEVYYIRQKVSGGSTIVIKAKPKTAGQNIVLNGVYTWQANWATIQAAAGHLNKNAPIATVYNYIGILGAASPTEIPPCTKPANTTGTALNTIVGITDLGRANKGNANNSTEWPMMRKGGWLALESNNKGFVVTRMTTTQITAISAPQEGMIVYDTTAKCLKLYNGTKWSCFSQPVCPKF